MISHLSVHLFREGDYRENDGEVYHAKVRVKIWGKKSIHVSAIVQKCTKANFLKVCIKVKLNEKLCLIQNIGSHTPGQGQIRRSKVKLFLKNYRANCF